MSYAWAEIGYPGQKVRFECLSQYLNERGFANVFHFHQTKPEDLDSSLEQILANHQSIRVTRPFGELVLSHFTHSSALMATLKSSDLLVCKDKRWWPQNLLYEALQALLAEEHASLDLSSSVLLVGAGSSARTTVAAVLRMGFFKINITDQFEERGQELVRDLRKLYFNAQIEFIPPGTLNALPGIHSLVVNTTPLNADNQILTQLYYFNFMQIGGLVIDYTVASGQTPLMKEALDVGGRVIGGIQVASYVDQIWADHCLGFKLDRKEYQEKLAVSLGEISFELPTSTEAD